MAVAPNRRVSAARRSDSRPARRGVLRSSTSANHSATGAAVHAPAPRLRLLPHPRRHRRSLFPTPIPAASPPRVVVEPERILVGLATDRAVVSLPCCRAGRWAGGGRVRFELTAPVEVSPGVDGPAGVFRLQVAALEDETQARRLATDLGSRSGQPIEVVFDAERGLYRVYLGRYSSRDAAIAARPGLQRLGVTDTFVVSQGPDLERPLLRLRQGERAG